MLCMYSRPITKACCQEINSNLTQGIGLENYLVLLNSLDALSGRNYYFKSSLVQD